MVHNICRKNKGRQVENAQYTFLFQNIDDTWFTNLLL